MNLKSFFLTLAYIGLAGAVLLLSHYGYSWVAALLVLMPMALIWLRSGRNDTLLLDSAPAAIVGLSVVVLVGLSRPPLGQPVFPVATQIAITVLYAAALVWLRRLRHAGRATLGAVALQQGVATTAIFLATAFWHWPESLAVGLMWAVSTLAALWYLRAVGERSAAILATAWGLVAAELTWILNTWQVNYILLGGGLIIPQAALVLTGVGYCFASIYHSHSLKRLSRRRLIEYVAIAGVVLAIVIAGTRWNGTT